MSSSSFRFLHVSDVHLGCPHYQSKERQRDFFLAFESVIERFALPLKEGDPPQVDFVVIPGDLFDSRNLQPITLSRASYVLSLLRDEGIPVFASEGNHDTAQHRYRGEPSWYNYLAGEGFLHYLQDRVEGGEVFFDPWDDEDLCGGYYDLPNGVRIIGTQWYGTRAEAMLEPIVAGLSSLSPADFTIMLFHGGLTDYVGSSSGGAEYEQFIKLRPYVDYLALGHIHKQYQRQNWMFNPGSLEVTKINDYFEKHGVLRVSVELGGDSPEITAEHLSDYRRRPVVWMSLSCDLYSTPIQLEQAIRDLIDTEGKDKLEQCRREFPSDIEFVDPICYLELTGTLGFPFSEIPLSELEPWIMEELGAAIFRHHNRTIPRKLGGEEDFLLDDGRIDREALERKVFTRLIADDTRFKEASDALADWAVSLKQEILMGDVSAKERERFVERLGEILDDIDPETGLALEEVDSPNVTLSEDDGGGTSPLNKDNMDSSLSAVEEVVEEEDSQGERNL